MEEKIKFYFDEHMPRAVEQGVVEHGYEVVMAVEVDMIGKDDDTEHLPFAAEKGAVVVTRDLAFAGRAAKRSDHAGLICWTGAQNDFGGMIRALAEFAESYTSEEVAGHVFWLK
jgi:predicted nuclease of predicted toxin-antitoxin system